VRLAWIGPAPSQADGASYVGTQLLGELARAGVEVDCFVAAEPGDLPQALRDEPGLRFFTERRRWSPHRWPVTPRRWTR